MMERRLEGRRDRVEKEERHRGTAYGEIHWPAVQCCSGRVSLMVAARFHSTVSRLL